MPEIGGTATRLRPQVSEYGILRGVPESAGRKPSPASVEDGKENALPKAHPRAAKRSPLPVWYPRTPLRDITEVVRAMERRRALLRARRRRINIRVRVSPATASPVSVLQQEPSTPEASSSSSPQSAASHTANVSFSHISPSTIEAEATPPTVATSSVKISSMFSTPSVNLDDGEKRKIIEKLKLAMEHQKNVTGRTAEQPRRSRLLLMR